MFLAPPADGLVTHLQTTTDFAVIQALCKQFHSLEPTLLQSHEVAPNASRIAHAGLDTAKLNFVPLYYARFSRKRSHLKCPICGDMAFRVEHNRDVVWFDALGPPWPKHKCF